MPACPPVRRQRTRNRSSRPVGEIQEDRLTAVSAPRVELSKPDVRRDYLSLDTNPTYERRSPHLGTGPLSHPRFREEYDDALEGYTVAVATHLEAKSGVLIETLREAGAEALFAPSESRSTHGDVVTTSISQRFMLILRTRRIRS